MTTGILLNDRERFLAVMEYADHDRVPNHELGVWPQTIERWKSEGLQADAFHWDWFAGEDCLDMDSREFISIDLDMHPPFEHKVLERTDRHEIFRDQKGIVHKALLEGMVNGGRTCMDQYISFPVTDRDSFDELKVRYAQDGSRIPTDLAARGKAWQSRTAPLILGRNCQILGFYWRAREWMGTENLSLAWYDHPAMMHAMMEFIADFTIETCRPFLSVTDVEYVTLNEDMAMKTGPLLSPETYRTYILPHMRRLTDFFKSNGVKYVGVDCDGNCEKLLPMLMDAGVEVLWPLERAAHMDPVRLRREYGRDLRLWGGVDKRELAKGKAAIDRHLAALAGLIAEGGYIPTVDHTVSPDISLANFMYYLKTKRALLAGES